jgi:pimeloyl-ACP methyl ester carboxylesterase
MHDDEEGRRVATELTRTPGQDRSGAGTPLVLLHGAACSWRVWKPVLPELARHHDVLALTLPGHRGGPQLAPATFEAVVSGVEQLLDRHGIERAHLAGNSLGGAVALELLRRGRALSVTCFSPGGAWAPAADLPRVRRAFHVAVVLSRLTPIIRLLALSPWARRRMFLTGFERGDLIPRRDFVELVADTRYAGSGLLALLADLIHRGPMTVLDPQGVPAVIAWPERDRLLPYDLFGVPFETLVPGCSIVRLPGVGHGPFYDDPALVAATILATTSADAARKAG